MKQLLVYPTTSRNFSFSKWRRIRQNYSDCSSDRAPKQGFSISVGYGNAFPKKKPPIKGTVVLAYLYTKQIFVVIFLYMRKL